MVPTLTPAFIIPEGIGGGISGGGENVALASAGVVAAVVIVGGLAVVAAPVVGALAAKAAVLTTAGGPGLLAIGAFLKGLDQLREWGLLNFRPPEVVRSPQNGDIVVVSPGINAAISISWDSTAVSTNYTWCHNGAIAVAGSSTTLSVNNARSGTGTGFRFANLAYTNTSVCGSDPLVGGGKADSIMLVKADGSESVLFRGNVGYVAGGTQAGSQTISMTNFRKSVGGVVSPLTIGSEGEFAPGVRPRLFPQTLPDAPTLPAPPLREPLQTPTLPPPPDRRPLAPPVTIPRPGQDPARVPVPGPRPNPAPGPGPSPTPSQPAPAGVPAIGPLPLPIPLPVPTTPGSVVIVDGQPIGGPGQAPAPNLVAIAQELGRLERKAELTLQAGNRGVTSDLLGEIIAREVEALLRSLILGLFDDVPAGFYELQPPCPGPGGEAPAGPDVVEWTASATPLIDLRKRIDAVAELIQLHKNQGQPTCKTAVSGQEVTIHFESDS